MRGRKLVGAFAKLFFPVIEKEKSPRGDDTLNTKDRVMTRKKNKKGGRL